MEHTENACQLYSRYFPIVSFTAFFFFVFFFFFFRNGLASSDLCNYGFPLLLTVTFSCWVSIKFYNSNTDNTLNIEYFLPFQFSWQMTTYFCVIIFITASFSVFCQISIGWSLLLQLCHPVFVLGQYQCHHHQQFISAHHHWVIVIAAGCATKNAHVWGDRKNLGVLASSPYCCCSHCIWCWIIIKFNCCTVLVCDAIFAYCQKNWVCIMCWIRIKYLSLLLLFHHCCWCHLFHVLTNRGLPLPSSSLSPTYLH